MLSRLMTTPATETEFKFAVRDASAFSALVAHLGLPLGVLDQGMLQTNHFFDTRELSLRGNGLALRLREQAGTYFLTIKGGKSDRSEDGILSTRIEEERQLDAATAQAMLNGSIAVKDVIAAQFDDHSRQLVDRIKTICEERPLVYIGKFDNSRIKLPAVNLAVGGHRKTLVFELDTIAFPGQAHQYEIELEIPSSEDAAIIKDELVSLLSAAGIEWESAPSKAQRFFELAEQTKSQ